MEIVKRLKGSAPEEVNYDFEEHHLHEDEETTKRKKGTLFTIITLIVIASLGYLGFKNFNTKNIETSSIVTNSPPVTQNVHKTTIATVKSMPIVHIKPKEIEKTVTYTEVLAQTLKPKPTQKVTVSPPKKKIILSKPKTIIVKKGDTLALISKKFYGSSTEFNQIILANKSIKSHKTNLKIGQKIIIPSNKKSNKAKVNSKKKRIITVKRGDTLNIIAQRFYGNSMKFKGIIRANKNIKNSKSRLKLGQKIIVPYLAKSERRRFITVKKGYSLAYISKKFYGNTSEVKRIVNANYNIKSAKSTLGIGQKVYVPR